jgi:phenylacetic acid degradation operon negative regulatory protein
MAARRSSAVAAAALKPTQNPTQAPTLSRRHAAGAPSARGLLFTLLGEFVLTGDGLAWTSAVLVAFARLGIEEKATRQALMRTAASGWLDAEKVGRRTRWRLTASARRMLTEGADRIYSFTGPSDRWDGRWLLVYARIPESDRRARHVVRSRLSWAGFGSLGGGVWISPHPDREAEAIQVLREAGVAQDAHVFVATRSGLADVQVMVAAAWDLSAVEEQYQQFIEDFSDAAPADVLARQVELVHAWRRFPAVDPVLPRELLPARWSGLKAARLFSDRHQRWSTEAAREWKRLNDLG